MRSHSTKSPYYGLPILNDNGRLFFAPNFSPVEFSTAAEKLHVVTMLEESRPDIIAHRSLSDPLKWWAIMRHNDVKDPCTLRSGDNLRIPLGAIVPSFAALTPSSAEDEYEVLNITNPVPPALVTFISDEAFEQLVEPINSVFYSFNFTAPGCLIGRINFELQVASDSDFEQIVLSTLSAPGASRWFWMNPENSGYDDWPDYGLIGPTISGTPCYFNIWTSDPVATGRSYFIRYRPVVTDNSVVRRGAWSAAAIKL